ncbi:MAG: sensor domain-containing protein [Gemmatimonadota bacterium]
MQRPRTALEALTWRRLLASSWPWRSAGYLLATLPVALVAAALLAVPAVPWLVLAAGGYPVGVVVLLVLLGAALIAGAGPLIAVPVASLARRRLHLADTRPLGSAARRDTAAGGAVPWLRARYTDPAAWRQTGYVCLLATVVPVLSIAALLAAPAAAAFIASPFLVLAQQPGGSPVALGFGHVATVPQTLPYLIGGLVLLPLAGYLVTLVAGADAAVARALLLGGPDEQLRAELTEVTRSRARLADAFEAERRRIERDLHDGAQQKLVSLTMQLGLARLDLPPGSPAADAVVAAHDQAKQLMAELRELIHGIQPQVLSDLGLPAALGELADSSPVPVTVDANLDGRLPDRVENTAYFVAAEALTNIAKHSGATSATVTARRHGNLLVVEISDNGRGGADPARGTGLTGLADRVAVAGGRMLLSSPPGGPTLLRAELPCS